MYLPQYSSPFQGSKFLCLSLEVYVQYIFFYFFYVQYIIILYGNFWVSEEKAYFTKNSDFQYETNVAQYW